MTIDNSNQISEKLLHSIKMQEDSEKPVTTLSAMDMAQLQKDLLDDGRKKAFWINIYNAYFLILRKIRRIEKPKIYRDKLINIAGEKFSLDDIEHGILRKYRYKFSLGYLPNLFTSKLIKSLAVKHIDYRIHFALNCGAKSCPPIAFYSVGQIDKQLELATLAFLEGETEVFPDKKEVHISRLMKWYHGDFGGNAGIRKMLKDKLNIDTQKFRLVYKDYSWEEDLDNFVELNEVEEKS